MHAQADDLQKSRFIDLDLGELAAIVERVKSGLNEEDHAKLKAAMDTLGFVTAELKNKTASIGRLRGMVFGQKTESTRRVFKGKKKRKVRPAEPKPGHGRRSAAAYTGAEKVKVPHASLKPGDCCPECSKGKVYPLAEPAKLVRFTGVAPLSATVWECERCRCNLCGEVYTAETPSDVGNEKYDESAMAMVGLLKYGCGLPFHRIEKLQEGFGIPLPASTQWDLVREASKRLEPVFEELVCEAAQGDVVYNDDTTARILDLTPEQLEAAADDDDVRGRAGQYTSGIVSVRGKRKIAVFFTGTKHAGENLADVLKRRAEELIPPIQMCDALAANTAGGASSIVANCNSHSRRRFVEVVDNFPEECRFVLETIGEVYHNDDLTRDLTPEARLEFHRSKSGPLMGKLKRWMHDQLNEHKTEPNSGLGKAIRYMLKHWKKLVLFLRKPGAPLDNNICEQALKMVIRHRKNSLFFRTQNGARTGDVFMSLIHSADLSRVEPFDYLVTVLRHHDAAAETPGAWMPWNYRQTALQLAAQRPAP